MDEGIRDIRIALLQAAGVAEAANEPLDLAALASELDVSEQSLGLEIEQLEAVGLMLTAQPAFASAVDEALALDLFAAAVALLARLSAGHPAGCDAEEILAVGLIEHATAQLEMRADNGELTEAEAASAVEALGGVFELFE